VVPVEVASAVLALAVGAVGQRITSAVYLGLLSEGEQLPSEAALAERLGVSTVTLREALVHLRAEGIIETRRGRNGGSFVRKPVESSRDALNKRLRNLSSDEWRDLGDELAVESEDDELASRLAREHAQACTRRIRQLRLSAIQGRRRRASEDS
jgi:GntR family transcriptional repressor for pyruvate dehydrogenase complex